MTFRETKEKKKQLLFESLCKEMKNTKSTKILFLAVGSKLFADFRFPCRRVGGRGELELNPAKSEE